MPDQWWNGAPPPRPPVPAPRITRTRYWLHILLFAATAVTTTLTGGPFYGAGIMAILLAHEMGHYVMARRHGVPATLPFFLPMPFSLFGTFGAVIRMANVGADRRALFDIAVAGPIAGLVLAMPACLIGLKMSRVIPVSGLDHGHISLGSSILFQWFSDLFFGKLPPGQDIELHPLAFAGWAGLFVSALNLLPVGQLDGGHVVYALAGRKSFWVSLAAATGFLALAIFVSRTWLLFAVLIFVFGIEHPPTADDSVPIDTRRRILGIALLILFFLTFPPKPVSF